MATVAVTDATFDEEVRKAQSSGFNIKYSIGNISQEKLENIYKEREIEIMMKKSHGKRSYQYMRF